MLRGLTARVRSVDRVRVDQFIAVAVLLEIELQIWLGGSIHDRAFAGLAGVALALAVAVRRRWALGAAFVVPAFMSLRMLIGLGDTFHNAAGVIVSVLLLNYGLGAFASGRRSVQMLVFAVVITSLNALTKPGGGLSAAIPVAFFAVLSPYVLGRMMRAQAARSRDARDVAEQLDRGRDASARTAAYGERARIARELHDVIAHSMSVMVIQAGGARLVMDEQPERAEESLRSVERAGREALAEMRRLLGILGDGDPHALAPQPGLGDIEPLLADARASGIDADLRIDGEPARVSPALDLCAYRIVQEALTNAIKHASPARASVNVRWRAGELELEVSDDGSRRRTVPGAGGGHGIPGIRERVALHSGTVHAGARPDGGFTVHARLPLAQEARC